MNRRYILKLWNNKFGLPAAFIAQDTKTGKYCEFCTQRPKDISWVNTDLTKLPEYKSWKDFEDAPVDELEDIVM